MLHNLSESPGISHEILAQLRDNGMAIGSGSLSDEFGPHGGMHWI